MYGEICWRQPAGFINWHHTLCSITILTRGTLPVKFDASARALKWLGAARITKKQEHSKTTGFKMGSTYLAGCSLVINSYAGVVHYDLYEQKWGLVIDLFLYHTQIIK